MSAKKILYNWLAADELEKVLQGLFSLAKKYEDQRLLHNTTLQSGRLKALKSKRIGGVLSNSDSTLESNAIREALIQINNDLSEDWTMEEAEVSGYSQMGDFKQNEKTATPAEPKPVVTASTSGEKSPVVIKNGDGDVNISYG